MINYDLTKIKALAFDVDGVLSTNNVYLSDDGDGQPQRTANIKDGYAMQLAVKCGLKLAIITGGRSAAVKKRYENLGVQNVFAGISVKIACFQHWLETENLKPEEVLYMGDDIPDYEVMRACGLPCCPADAAEEIKRISCYISDRCGGMGCVRDVIEAAKANDYEAIIIADHGNADNAINADGTPNTAHSLNHVPFIYVTDNNSATVKNGRLADVAPSILHIMGLEQPADMTGENLIEDNK